MEKVIPQLVFIVAVFLIFYYFTIRPQRKKLQAQQVFLASLRPGTMVITAGGIYGKVVEVETDCCVLELDSGGSQMTIEKSAISVEATQKYTLNHAQKKS